MTGRNGVRGLTSSGSPKAPPHNLSSPPPTPAKTAAYYPNTTGSLPYNETAQDQSPAPPADRTNQSPPTPLTGPFHPPFDFVPPPFFPYSPECARIRCYTETAAARYRGPIVQQLDPATAAATPPY